MREENVCQKQKWRVNEVVQLPFKTLMAKPQVSVFDSLPPTAAVTGYAIGLKNVSWQFFTDAQMADSL